MQRNFPVFPLFALGVVLAPAGCAPPGFESPAESMAIDAPVRWQASTRGDDGAISRGWLDEFRAPEMRRAVERAMENNQDLAAAAARMREADYVRIAGRSRGRPNLDLGQSASFSLSENGPDFASSERESYNLSVSASWEADLWGRLADLDAADEADFAAARATYRGARLSLAASAARAWVELIAAEQQLDLARVILESFERNLRISERIYKGTGEGALDVQFGRNNVASAQGSVESRQLARDDAARTLEVLAGRYPAGRSRAGSELPDLRRDVPAGLPAELIERRPDLAAARARLFASAKRADASRKSLLPSLGLTGSASTPVEEFRNLLDPEWLAASIAANFAQALYSGGRLSNEARAALERNRAALHDYRQAALEAFREVESTLAADRSLAEQERFLITEVEQADLAEAQATRDYSEGVAGSSILDVLEAQRRANSAKASLIALRNRRLQNRIDLHLALGGDFETRTN